ncbi:HupE/UreJ family protein [Sphingomonas azotifigens]|uniref:HupE/UreJ family protein n=1 Tax=Sphingomonas azotifigens TaxID=330920 RepID=UPI0009FF7255|nr:HupE/UreJ family protein [Sphingomonas azotifigens]
MLALLLPSAAWAHLLPRQNATLHVERDRAYLAVSVPVSAFTDVDDNRDGLLDAGELGRHAEAIGAQFRARFHVLQGARAAPLAFTWVAHPGSDSGLSDPTPYVVVMAGAQLAAPVETVTLATDLFGATAQDARYVVRARIGDRIEAGVLDPVSPRHVFFRGPGALFAVFLGVGIEHILLGYDHLLFLLTILMGVAGWRRWIAVVTAFTLAHSITLTLGALGLVRLDPAIVEPGIALSIAAMAALNLFGPAAPRARIGIVFACGLLHGLGFAGVLTEMGLGQGNRLATLAGFNLGVELGQLLFLGALLGAAALLARAGQGRLAAALPRFASMLALLLGLILLAMRLPL